MLRKETLMKILIKRVRLCSMTTLYSTHHLFFLQYLPEHLYTCMFKSRTMSYNKKKNGIIKLNIEKDYINE